jgi:nitroimidazol reductase NimA-like FMN-containing flavoprotein (pyridoxamine 5'-phosphate oxidase superfamily)
MVTVEPGSDLSPDECRDLLRAGGIGRVGVSVGALPAIFPVRYHLVDDDIVFAAARDPFKASLAGTVIAFEADAFDPDHTTGWSVLVVGRVESSADAGTTRVPSDHISGLRFRSGADRGSIL